MELLAVFVLAGTVYLVVLLAMDACLPSWRWALPFIAAVWGALGYLWLDHAQVTSRPGHDPKFNETVGVAIGAAVTLGVLLGTIIYACIVAHRIEKHRVASNRGLTREELRRLLD
jgi:hypothetical protein